MLDNLYTTKMSANKKTLQNRFSKIRSKSGRISKMMSFIMAILVAVTFACATVVMAAVDQTEKIPYKIVVMNNDQAIAFDNQPFFQNKTVYIPLRELLEKCDLVTENENAILWDNGEIYLTLSEKMNDEKSSIATYAIKIGINSREIIYNPEKILPYGKKEAEFTALLKHPPILKDGLTYIPFCCADTIIKLTKSCLIKYLVWDLNYNSNIKRDADYTNDIINIEYGNYLIKSGMSLYDDYTTDKNDAGSVLETFLKALYREDYPKMTTLCTDECVNNHFVYDGKLQNASVYGIHKASPKSIAYGYVNKENDYTKNPITVTLNCEMPPYSSAIGGEREIKVYFEKQSDGTFLISDFSS